MFLTIPIATVRALEYRLIKATQHATFETFLTLVEPFLPIPHSTHLLLLFQRITALNLPLRGSGAIYESSPQVRHLTLIIKGSKYSGGCHGSTRYPRALHEGHLVLSLEGITRGSSCTTSCGTDTPFLRLHFLHRTYLGFTTPGQGNDVVALQL